MQSAVTIMGTALILDRITGHSNRLFPHPALPAPDPLCPAPCWPGSLGCHGYLGEEMDANAIASAMGLYITGIRVAACQAGWYRLNGRLLPWRDGHGLTAVSAAAGTFFINCSASSRFQRRRPVSSDSATPCCIIERSEFCLFGGGLSSALGVFISLYTTSAPPAAETVFLKPVCYQPSF